jgi:hypothetical protein
MMTASTKRGERKPAPVTGAPQAGFDSLSRYLRDRDATTPCFTHKSGCEALRQANCGALHTCTIAHDDETKGRLFIEPAE